LVISEVYTVELSQPRQGQVEGGHDPVAEYLAGGAAAQHVGVVDAVPTRQYRVDQGQQLAAGLRRARPVAQVDQRIGGLLSMPTRSASVAASSRPALATAWVSSKQVSSWSRVWGEDAIEKVPF
jgi:hypothetical protein